LSISGNSKSWIDDLRRAERLPANYTAMVFDYVVPLAERVRALRAFRGCPIVIGINGAQGSGKSTLALFLANWLEREKGLSSVILSLDDLYLDKPARESLGDRYHPLLRTRGVPGTHDVALGVKTLDALTRRNSKHVIKLPVFDKATDRLLKQTEWRSVDGPVDVVLFEGWCVAARPQSDECLNGPVNALEAEDDPDGVWRRFANEKLKGGYLELFGWIDAIIMLRIPSFDQVFEWRGLQEQKLRGDADAAESDKASQSGMNTAEVRRFVMHFERLTRQMLETMPDYANTVIDIDDSHNMANMIHRNWPFEGASRDPRT